MSDVERTRGLMGTDDAMVWAEEFCRIFQGHVIETNRDEHPSPHPEYTKEPIVDVGTMVGWFANAMQVAIDIYERRKLRIKETPATRDVPDTAREAFVEGVDDGRRPSDLDDPTG